mmetsp:Transcript_21352/g.52282  ORF Transcript_21352/g.52282 Transcript_21352/m.52282 type:complete len:481 (-) Transcript_21352:136-1578(-)
MRVKNGRVSLDLGAPLVREKQQHVHPKTDPDASKRLYVLLKTIGTLAVLSVFVPLSLLAMILVRAYKAVLSGFSKKTATRKTSPKTVMLTGGKMTKSLQLSRKFYENGHRVIMIETDKYWLTGHRYSTAVSEFYTVPAPEKDAKGYVKALVDIAVKERVELFVPVSSPVSSVYSAMAKQKLEKNGCEVLHFDPETCKILDDKYLFCKKARELGLSAPQVHLISDQQELIDFDFTSAANAGKQYIIKSICYDSVTRLDLTKLPCPNLAEFARKLPISKTRPWVMQEFIRGKEYCTHSLCRDGEVVVYCCSESSPFQVNYEHVDKSEIKKWVIRFAKAMNLTGQASFDFIETKDGKVYPIECNPRTHTAITTFHDHPDLADAYVGRLPPKTLIEPLETSIPTYWIAHELHRMTQAGNLSEFLRVVGRIYAGKDAMLSADDPMPFLMVHHWHIPLLLLTALLNGKEWVRIDFNIGKLVEVGGD